MQVQITQTTSFGPDRPQYNGDLDEIEYDSDYRDKEYTAFVADVETLEDAIERTVDNRYKPGTMDASVVVSRPEQPWEIEDVEWVIEVYNGYRE